MTVIEKVFSPDTVSQGISALKTTIKEEPAVKAETFQNLFQQWIKAVSDSEHNAQSLAHQFSIGAEDVSIHQVMIAAQKSFITIKASTEITKRCLNAYQEIWNMPI